MDTETLQLTIGVIFIIVVSYLLFGRNKPAAAPAPVVEEVKPEPAKVVEVDQARVVEAAEASATKTKPAKKAPAKKPAAKKAPAKKTTKK